jgi:hypothetical protein
MRCTTDQRNFGRRRRGYLPEALLVDDPLGAINETSVRVAFGAKPDATMS